MVIQSLKREKLQEEDCVAIFKPGLWQTGFFWMRQRIVPFSAVTI